MYRLGKLKWMKQSKAFVGLCLPTKTILLLLFPKRGKSKLY